MPHRAPLPPLLDPGVFTTAEARESGVPRGRLRAQDIVHPFHGMNAAGVLLDDVESACEALTPLLAERQWFSHVTAARLWGMPLPENWVPAEPLHTLALAGSHRMQRVGVIGWETERSDIPRSMLGLLPVVSPATVWAQLAMPGAVLLRDARYPDDPPRRSALSAEWLVAVGDFLVSGKREKPRRPLCTIAELTRELAAHRGKRGAKALAWALERVRSPVDSSQETFLRLGLIEAGLPEPDVQVPVVTAGGLRHADLGYPDSGVLMEYQGDEHRTSRRRWLDDLTRRQLFEDAGYLVIEVGADDMYPDCRALGRRVRRALDRRHFSA